MSSSPVHRNRYKLESEFGENVVTHRTFKTDLRTRQRRIEVRTTWTRERILGAGAFGEVRLESEHATGELRAVKAISKTQVNISEVEALIELQDHPALFIRFLGWFEDPYAVHIAMEYIEYGDLSQYISQHAEEAKMGARAIITQILEGLVVLHEREICHRDLKPQNILIASRSPIWVKITDFGISKNCGGSGLQTHCGTVAYQAPELLGLLPKSIITNPQSYTKNVDLWALGVLVHEVLTSEIPFLQKAQSIGSMTDSCLSATQSTAVIDMDLLFHYCRGEPFPIATLQRHGVGPGGIDLVKSLMVADPMNRVSAAEALKKRWLVGVTFAEANSTEPSLGSMAGGSEQNSPSNTPTSRIPTLPLGNQHPDLIIRASPSPSPPPQVPGSAVRHPDLHQYLTLDPQYQYPVFPPNSPPTVRQARSPPAQHTPRLEHGPPGNLVGSPPSLVNPVVTIGLLGTIDEVNWFSMSVGGGPVDSWEWIVGDKTSDMFKIDKCRVHLVKVPELSGFESLNIHDGRHLWDGIIYMNSKNDEPLHGIAEILGVRNYCEPHYLNSTIIVIPTISTQRYSEWEELVRSGAMIHKGLDCEQDCVAIVRRIIQQQPQIAKAAYGDGSDRGAVRHSESSWSLSIPESEHEVK